MSERTVTLIVEKWVVRPPEGYARFMPHSEKEIQVRETAKRFITLERNPTMRKSFDKATGREVKARGFRFHSWFRYSIKVEQDGQAKEEK